MKIFVSEKDFKNFVIYKGQKFEADAAYIDIYQQATTSIYVVDDYMQQYREAYAKSPDIKNVTLFNPASSPSR